MDMNELAQLVSCALGKSWTSEDLLETGDRIWNLERLFNLREGFTRADDTLPSRLLKEPMKQGPAKGHVVELEVLLEDYYKARHWDSNGVPTPEVLDSLGLAKEGGSILDSVQGDR
jgi:aldehyde:ferredoxin oxidoreductase